MFPSREAIGAMTSGRFRRVWPYSVFRGGGVHAGAPAGRRMMPSEVDQAGVRLANRAISFFWPTLPNLTINFMSASPPSTAMIVPTPNWA